MRSEQRATLSTHVYAHIEEMLIDGRLPLGKAISIDGLSESVGVSRQPVMDALRKLAGDGFVNIVPQVGCYPREYELREILDFFQLFADFEGTVAGFAAERTTAAALIELRGVSAQIGLISEASIAGQDMIREFRRLNRRFHSTVRSMANSTAVSEIASKMQERSDFLIALSRAPIRGERLQAAHNEHEALIEAISAHDAEGAKQIMRGHILTIGERIRNISEAA